VKNINEVLREHRVDKATEAVKTIEEKIKMIKELLREIHRASAIIHHLKTLADKYSGCTEEYTYVYNKMGKQYHYWYLKCPDKNPSSIYLGTSGGKIKAIKRAGKSADEFIQRLHEAMRAVEEMSKILEELKTQVAALKTS